MAVTASPFCEHKKLRTACPQCKATAVPAAPTLAATPYVSQEEREKAAQKRAAKADRRAAAAPGEEREKVDRESRTPRATGPGKPLMPVRSKKKAVSADEAATATAWWVKK